VTKFQQAVARLASKIQNGELLAQTNVTAFVDAVADKIERLQRELNRANRIAGKADRMYDAIDRLRNYTVESMRLESIQACKTAADEYDLALSDPAAEATDATADTTGDAR
jgi:hypothetical protein